MRSDRRKRRFRADCTAELSAPGLSLLTAQVIDLSEGGAFIETAAAWPLGLRVKLKLLVPAHAPLIFMSKVLRTGSVEKRVKHPELEYLVVRARGLAVKFDPLSGDTARGLLRYLATLEEL